MAKKRVRRPGPAPVERGRGKEWTVVAVLAFAALWPLVHRVLVARYDVNPWKLAGWAMYTTPTPPVLAVVFQPVGKGGVPIDPAKLPAPVGAALDRFRLERHALGDLRRPDDVAALVLQARADLPEIVVMVQRMTLDPETALMTSRKAMYRYDRTGLLLESRSG